MESADLDRVYELSKIHELYESIDIFIERHTLCPEGCFVLGDWIGYAISHPYSLESPSLNTLLYTLPKTSTCWYLHDIVILPSYRNFGYAKSLLDKITQIAKKHSKTWLTLTAVNGTDSFWLRQGFDYVPSIQCSSYGDAFFMIKSI
jgi:GNAT superfamily N-acetyltransferase